MSSVRLPSEVHWDINGPLTALAGGGQTGAPALSGSKMNRVTVVATAADSVKMPLADTLGRQLIVINSTANSLNVFPFLGDSINALSANTAFAVAAGKMAIFNSPAPNIWFVLLSA